MAASLIEAKLYLEQEEFANVRVFPRTPRCRNFLLHTDQRGKEWWSAHQSRFPKEEENDSVPSTMFALERILPLPSHMRNALIEEYFEEEDVEEALTDSTNDACLARVYLGKDHTKLFSTSSSTLTR